MESKFDGTLTAFKAYFLAKKGRIPIELISIFDHGAQNARIDTTRYSLARAALRLQHAKRKRDDPDEDMDAEINWALNQAENLSLEFSEVEDDGPLSGCSFSPDRKRLATWFELCSLTKSHPYLQLHLLMTARYWNDQGTLLRTFEGHIDRLARIAFHPSGKYLGALFMNNLDNPHMAEIEVMIAEPKSNARHYIRELMEKCKNIVSNHEDLSTMKPTEVITSGASETQKSESSAILVAHFDGQERLGQLWQHDGKVELRKDDFLHYSYM
ncbi:hypothetical protein Ahy_A03g013158 [Arachis hypogaea]|uniref:Uncharacterized protein n=1 Tax=Arachis hypogaea TaxID=3818 RepID=A0A445DUW1_ARAHY|nr:hypothetical protein Ahy_A03g013158 [Arachis hypogaea]